MSKPKNDSHVPGPTHPSIDPVPVRVHNTASACIGDAHLGSSGTSATHHELAPYAGWYKKPGLAVPNPIPVTRTSHNLIPGRRISRLCKAAAAATTVVD
jgi:hypothetical protein